MIPKQNRESKPCLWTSHLKFRLDFDLCVRGSQREKFNLLEAQMPGESGCSGVWNCSCLPSPPQVIPSRGTRSVSRFPHLPRGHILHPKLSSPGGAGQELLVMMALSSLSSGAIPSPGVSFLVTLAGNIPRLEKQQEALIPAFLPVEGLSRAGPAASRAGIGNAARPEPFPAHPGIPTPGAFSEFVFPQLPLFPAASKGCGWRGADPADP